MEEVKQCLRDVKQALKEHGEILARLDERSVQQEKRMDRTDRRSTGFGAIAGLVGGVIGGFLKTFVGGGGSS